MRGHINEPQQGRAIVIGEDLQFLRGIRGIVKWFDMMRTDKGFPALDVILDVKCLDIAFILLTKTEVAGTTLRS